MDTKVLVLSSRDVDDIAAGIDPIEIVTLMQRVFNALSRSNAESLDVVSPHRTIINSETQTTLFMPSRISVAGGTGIKVVSVPKRGGEDGLPATTLLFDDASGKLKAIVNARQLTALRNAAGSALATRLVGPHTPTNIVLFGAGLQILHHARLFLRIYSTLSTCTIFNRSRNDRLTHVVQRLQAEFPEANIEDGVTSDFEIVEKAMRAADLVCTATPSTVPLFKTAWVKHGAHFNLIGSYTPEMREVEAELIDRAGSIVVDSAKACLKEAGELVGIHPDRLIELGAISGDVKRSDQKADWTVFKSVGVGIQDVSIAWAVTERAKALGVGMTLDYD